MSISDARQVGLIASAQPGTDVHVIDANFKVVAHGARRVETSLPPGLYKVKFQAGSAVHEEHVALEPGSPTVVITQPRLEFVSSAPLSGTASTHEYQRDNAAKTSREVHVHDGAGSNVFIFARTWTSATSSDRTAALPRGQHPATGLALHDLEGRRVADLVLASLSDLQVPDAWSACSIDVKPGPYLLRLQIPNIGELAQTVIASAGWQAQVFLLQQNYGSATEPVYRPDLTTASVMLAREHEGFDPDSEMTRLTGLALAALTRQRAVVARDLLNRLLEMKFDNPMLGLYAAHTLPWASESARDVLRSVAGRLRELIGPHPDVDALSLHLGDTVARTYETPPMLRRSWQIVVEHSARDRALVPPGSMASRVAANIWGDSPWLIWDAGAANDVAGDDLWTVDSQTIENSVQRIEDVAARVVSEGEVGPDVDLDDIEQSLLSYATRSSKYRRKGARGTADRPRSLQAGVDSASLSERASKMVEDLGLPPSTVQRKAGRLLRKLGG